MDRGEGSGEGAVNTYLAATSQLGICQFFSRAGGEKGLCSDRLEAVAFTNTKKIDYEQLYIQTPSNWRREKDRQEDTSMGVCVIVLCSGVIYTKIVCYSPFLH